MLSVGTDLRPGRADPDAVAWLERATLLEPDDYWSQFYLGYYLGREGQKGRALEHYQAAVALRPDSPWARMNRALLYQARGDWTRALDDLNRVLESSQGSRLLKARFDLGFVKQVLGDDSGARAAYESVISQDKGGPLARAGRLNRAKLDIDAGAVDRGRSEYDALLAEDPRDAPARLSRAVLALRSGQPAQAESDLSIVLRDFPERADEILAPGRGQARDRSPRGRRGRCGGGIPPQADSEPRTSLGAYTPGAGTGRGPVLARSAG